MFDNETLQALYRDTLLHHSRSPRNFGDLQPPCLEALGHNPLCGDRVKVQIRLDDSGKISAIGFGGSGCAISMASASLMTQAVAQMDYAHAEQLAEAFRALCHSAERAEAVPLPSDHEDLEVFAGVRAFPMRVKCATLPWHALLAAFTGDKQASTEEAKEEATEGTTEEAVAEGTEQKYGQEQINV